MTSSNGSPLVLQRARLATPIDVLVLLQDADRSLRVLDWEDHAERMMCLLRRQYGAAGCAIVDREGRRRRGRVRERWRPGVRRSFETSAALSQRDRS